MKIKARVNLRLEKDGYGGEELFYIIRYKHPNKLFNTKIKQSIIRLRSWSSNPSEYADYLSKLEHYIQKENIVEISKGLILEQNIEKKQSNTNAEKHKQLMEGIRNMSKEQIEFEFEID